MTIYDDKTIARFWSKVDRRGPDECWEWTGSRWPGGYGQLHLSKPRRLRSAHIISYEIHFGPTGDLLVCHRCDNPPCVNPSHLWLGTNDENMADMVAKGRAAGHDQRGSVNANAILSDEDVLEIRRLISLGHYNTVIAVPFGVHHSMISKIRRGKAWTHI